MPYNCDGRSPLYAADIASPAFRRAWIQETVGFTLNANYPGLYIDNVNMEFRVSDALGNPVRPSIRTLASR